MRAFRPPGRADLKVRTTHTRTLSLPWSTRLGPYEITARIGAAGMGEVYRAKDNRLKREVALSKFSLMVKSPAEHRR